MTSAIDSLGRQRVPTEPRATRFSTHAVEFDQPQSKVTNATQREPIVLRHQLVRVGADQHKAFKSRGWL